MRFKRGHIVKNNLGNVGYITHAMDTTEDEYLYQVRWQFANGHYLGLGEFQTIELEKELSPHTLNYNEKVLPNE